MNRVMESDLQGAVAVMEALKTCGNKNIVKSADAMLRRLEKMTVALIGRVSKPIILTSDVSEEVKCIALGICYQSRFPKGISGSVHGYSHPQAPEFSYYKKSPEGKTSYDYDADFDSSGHISDQLVGSGFDPWASDAVITTEEILAFFDEPLQAKIKSGVLTLYWGREHYEKVDPNEDEEFDFPNDSDS